MKLIEKAIKTLLDTKPFYAHFFLNSKICYDIMGVKTAAAGVTKDSTRIIFCTEFIEKLTTDEVCSVIEHEVLHLLFQHHSAFKEGDFTNPKIANIAMDGAINQFITNLPKEAITLKALSDFVGEPLEPEQTWEYYYGKLMKKADELAENFDTLDDHSEFGKGDEADGSVSEQQARAITQASADKAIKASAGNVPKEVLKVYDQLSQQSQVPWQQVLSNFVARSTSSNQQDTRKRPNRRFGLVHPGKKRKRELTLGVCVDSSGSISDESYEKFMAELVRIVKSCHKVYFVEADCEVQDVQVITKKKKADTSRTGCGGTAYQPAITKCMELRCDAIVYFGDFDTSDTPADPGVPFLWVGVGNSPKPGNFGGEIRLD